MKNEHAAVFVPEAVEYLAAEKNKKEAISMRMWYARKWRRR